MKCWDKNEIELLKKLNGKVLSWEEFKYYFPLRDFSYVIRYAKSLGYKISKKREKFKHWTKEDDILLLKYDKEELLKFFPDRPWKYIIHRKNKILKKKFKQQNWTISELDILKKSYNSLSQDKILKLLPNRTWRSIKQMAAKYKIKRWKRFQTNANCEKLVSNSLEFYYWVGFILADGNISGRRLMIGLSLKDEYHLQKFCNFLKTNLRKHKNTVWMSLQDDVIYDLAKRFDIKHNKTYNPCKISCFLKLNDDELLSLIIGFIDGDGSIKNQYKRKDCSLSIKLHKSWESILLFFEDKIYQILGFSKERIFTKINKEGYALMNISNNKVLKSLKNFCQKNNLPVLNRKWDKIIL